MRNIDSNNFIHSIIIRVRPTIFLSLIGLPLFTGCNRMENKEIKKSWWKYGSGYHIGDALRFDENNLKGDTLYSDNKPLAVVSSCGKGLFRKTSVLKIKDLETGKVGTYNEKGPR